jgi:glycosyltransferase involved in cell wall biosynthesis
MVEVSIIVPNYNHLSFINERLDSIFNQSFQDYEIILLDDNSTDGSREVLEEYRSHPKVSHCVANVTNSGSTFVQWEKGISLATGKFIWFAESDDVADVDFLKTLVPIMESKPNVGIVFCQSEIINTSGEVLHNNVRWTDSLDKVGFIKDFEMKGIEAVRRFFIWKNIIPNASACLFRRELFFDAKWNANKFRYCGDWMLWIYMLLRSDLVFISKPLNLFRKHEGVTRIRRSFKKKEKYFLEVFEIRKFIFKALEINSKSRADVNKYACQTLLRAFSFRDLFLSNEGRRLVKKFQELDSQIELRLLYLFARRGIGKLKKNVLVMFVGKWWRSK